MKNCSFTGHRHIPDGHMKALSQLLDRAIEYTYSEGCRNFYTGGALGFDTMAARQLIRYKLSHSDMRLIIVVPCKNQDEKWSPSQRDAYEYILANADEIFYCSEEYTKDCMKKRNAYLAEQCDIMIAYSGRTSSGSAQTVRMAESRGKTVYNLYPAVSRSAAT